MYIQYIYEISFLKFRKRRNFSPLHGTAPPFDRSEIPSKIRYQKEKERNDQIDIYRENATFGLVKSLGERGRVQ